MPSLHIAINLIKRTMGTRRGLLMNVLIPAIALSFMAGLFGGAQGGKTVIAISNSDHGFLGEYLVATIKNDLLYEIKLDPRSSEQAVKAAVLNGEADAALFIPSDFTQKIVSGEKSEAILYRMNEQLWNAALAAMLETESNKLQASADLVRETGNQIIDLNKLMELLDTQAIPIASAENIDTKLGNIVSKPIMVGLLIMFVMLLLSQSIGFVLEDRDNRTLARMYTAPLRPIDIALGNFIGIMILGTIQLIVILSLIYYVFGYSPGVSIGSMLLVMECFLLAAVGIVSAIGGLVRDSAQLTQLNNLIIYPSCLISGCFFPLSMLPDFMQQLANFTPQKWAIQAIDRLGGGGGSFSDISLPLIILMLFAVVMTAFGSAVLRPNRTR